MVFRKTTIVDIGNAPPGILSEFPHDLTSAEASQLQVGGCVLHGLQPCGS